MHESWGVILEQQFLTYILFFCGLFHVIFLFAVNFRFNFQMRWFFFLDIVTSHFFVRVLKKIVTFCCSDSFVQKTIQQSDDGCNVTSDRQHFFLQIFEKTVLFFLQSTHRKKILRVKNTILPTTITRYASYSFIDITL